MDAKRDRLQKKLEDLLAQASAVAVELQGLDQGPGTPHYDQIELPAHALGQQFSRLIQSERAREIAAGGLADAACPTCGEKCHVHTQKREVHSMDGPLEMLETIAKCGRCRRSFFPQRVALGLDARESTPGFKRQVVLLNAETRSLKRTSIALERTCGLKVSPNTIERICLEVGADLAAAEEKDWEGILTGEVPVPEVAIVEYDGGRMRTRLMDCGPGVHLEGKGWNETKNAILVSAASAVSEVDPQPDPPACFANPKHVAKLTETAKTKENASENDDLPGRRSPAKAKKKRRQKARPAHQPKRILRTVLSSLKSSRKFGQQMAREARRRRFFEARRRAFVSDGLACNWAIHEAHFPDFTPILDFTHAVTYLFRASHLCCLKDESWSTYVGWMTSVWRGQVGDVIRELDQHQERLGHPPDEAGADDPREQLRLIRGYLENNRQRMHYDEYRRQGLPTTSAWMESAVKEMNWRVKGTEMFWNNPEGGEAILHIRAAALCDDNRLPRFLARRPGSPTLRRPHSLAQAL